MSYGARGRVMRVQARGVLIDLDGTENKSRLGANAMLAVGPAAEAARSTGP